MGDGTFVYDDQCGFCTWLADYFGSRTDLDLVAFSDVSDDLLERLPEDYEECSHLLRDGEVYSCGAAIEQALVVADVPPGAGDAVEFLRSFHDYERYRERVYWAMANQRGLLGQFLSKEQVGEQ